jgi:hypothetical protein
MNGKKPCVFSVSVCLSDSISVIKRIKLNILSQYIEFHPAVLNLSIIALYEREGKLDATIFSLPLLCNDESIIYPMSIKVYS